MILQNYADRGSSSPQKAICCSEQYWHVSLVRASLCGRATNNEEFKTKLFQELNDAYGIKDQGLLTSYLGVEVEQTSERITIRQGKYAREILAKLGYQEAHSVGNPMEVNARLAPLGSDESSDTSFPYREAVGMLMYLATSTRPDLAFALGQLSRFVAKPSGKHVGTLKRVLRYIAGTRD
jgi:hypothetical protein